MRAGRGDNGDTRPSNEVGAQRRPIPVKEPTVDPERLAALLDGRLDERERAEVLARLAASEEDFEAYVDAIAVTRELEAGDEAEGVTPLRPPGRRWWQRPGGHWLAIAAVLAGIALAPWLWTRASGPDLRDPGRYVALLEAEGAGLPAGWDRTPWAVTRGPGDPLTPEARAVRLGVRLTELELAARAGDPAAAALAGEIVALLEEVRGAGPVAAIYGEVRRRAGEPAETLKPLLEQGRKAVAQVAGEEMVALGAWAEAARVAAARRDAEFFRSRESREMLGRAGGLPGVGEPARAAVGRIRAALEGGGAMDWNAVEQGATELLRVLAR